MEIVRPPQDMFEPPGSDIVFEVELNKDRVEVKWMRNNMIIVQGDKYQMISEGKIHRLQVCEIRPRDQGEYRIVAKDKDARAKLELAGESTLRHSSFKCDRLMNEAVGGKLTDLLFSINVQIQELNGMKNTKKAKRENILPTVSQNNMTLLIGAIN